MTQVNNLHWGTSSWLGQNFNQSFTYVNNRIQKPDWLFDEDGRNTKSVADDGEATLKTFDAAGQLVRTLTGHADSVSFYSGQGDEIRRHVRAFNEGTGAWAAMPTKYYIRSSVLKGRVVSEVWGSGKKHRSYVKGIGSQTAVQTAYYTETSPLNESVIFEYSDAMGVSYRTTDKTGAAVASGDGGEGSPIETDPLGGSVGTSSPYFEEPVYIPQPEYPELEPYTPADLFAPDFSALYASLGSRVADLPGFGTNWGSFSNLGMLQYGERVHNAILGVGFNTNEQLGGIPGTRLTPIYGLLNPGEGTGMSPDGTTISVNTNWGIIDYEWASDDDWWSPQRQQADFAKYFDITRTIERIHFNYDSPENTKSALKALLGSNDGDCGKKLNDLLSTLGESVDVRTTDFLKLFEDVTGGLMLNGSNTSFRNTYRELTGVNPSNTAGGGGLAVSVGQAPRTPLGVFMLVMVEGRLLPRDYNDLTGVGRTLMTRLVHELAHAAGKDRTFTHEELGKAALKVDSTLVAAGVHPDTKGSALLNAFIEKNCTNFVSVSNPFPRR